MSRKPSRAYQTLREPLRSDEPPEDAQDSTSLLLGEGDEGPPLTDSGDSPSQGGGDGGTGDDSDDSMATKLGYTHRGSGEPTRFLLSDRAYWMALAASLILTVAGLVAFFLWASGLCVGLGCYPSPLPMSLPGQPADCPPSLSATHTCIIDGSGRVLYALRSRNGCGATAAASCGDPNATVANLTSTWVSPPSGVSIFCGVGTNGGTQTTACLDSGVSPPVWASNLNDGSRLNALAWVWGRFLQHDMYEPLFNGSGSVAAGTGKSAYSFADPSTGCGSQLSQRTPFIDGEMLYGRDPERLRLRARTGSGGRMMLAVGSGHNQSLPLELTNSTRTLLTGDPGSDEDELLMAWHTIWVREHNYWADRLLREVPWPENAETNAAVDEQIFWRARRIVVGEIQAITELEWAPTVLGPELWSSGVGKPPSIPARPSAADLLPFPTLPDNMLNIDLEFATMAGPPWTSMEGPGLLLTNSLALAMMGPTLVAAGLSPYNVSLPLLISGRFLRDALLTTDYLVRAAIDTPAHRMDPAFATTLVNLTYAALRATPPTDRAFHTLQAYDDLSGGAPASVNLPAVGVARGREARLPDWVTLATRVLGATVVGELLDDLPTGNNSCDPMAVEAVLGPWTDGGTSLPRLTGAIVADQLKRVIALDAYWWSGPQAGTLFPGKWLPVIKSTKLWDVLYRATIGGIPATLGTRRNLFLVPPDE